MAPGAQRHHFLFSGRTASVQQGPAGQTWRVGDEQEGTSGALALVDDVKSVFGSQGPTFELLVYCSLSAFYSDATCISIRFPRLGNSAIKSRATVKQENVCVLLHQLRPSLFQLSSHLSSIFPFADCEAAGTDAWWLVHPLTYFLGLHTFSAFF